MVWSEERWKITHPKFNMEPENDGVEKESPFPVTSFQVQTVSFREGNFFVCGKSISG